MSQMFDLVWQSCLWMSQWKILELLGLFANIWQTHLPKQWDFRALWWFDDHPLLNEERFNYLLNGLVVGNNCLTCWNLSLTGILKHDELLFFTKFWARWLCVCRNCQSVNIVYCTTVPFFHWSPSPCVISVQLTLYTSKQHHQQKQHNLQKNRQL